MKNVKKRGFTLIELLVVVLIIGILAAVAVPQYQKAVMKSRIVQLLTRADALYKAEKVYYLENGDYTRDVRLLDIDIYAANAEYGKTSAGTQAHTGIIYNGDAAGERCAVLKNSTTGDTYVLCTDDNIAILIYMNENKHYCRGRSNGGKQELAESACRSMAVGPVYTGNGYNDYPLN